MRGLESVLATSKGERLTTSIELKIECAAMETLTREEPSTYSGKWENSAVFGAGLD